MKQLHKNIKIFYLATTLTTLAASLPHAVLTVLLFAKGLSLTQIMLVQATYSLVILVSEYPSGLLADLYSKKVLFLWAAIMPSKYTDEIENSSYTWRVFYMSRKSKYSAEQKLAILNELTRSNISEVAKKYAVGKKTIRTWGYLYEYQGIDGLRSTHNNHRYSREFKLSLVQQYQKSDESLEIFAIKHGLKSKTQLSDWIMQYNESKLKAENRLLRAQLLRKEMEEAYAKKVMEIRDREGNDSSNNKPSKN